MDLTDIEIRVLGCLIEKAYTTPDQYPLSTNALMLACNQKTSRDPVVSYSEREVEETIQLLRDAGLARTMRPSGTRGHKHKHVIDEALQLSLPEQALLAVLMLRGHQSVGELNQRTERYYRFSSLEEIDNTLAALNQREKPLVENVGRQPGQSQDRWSHLLSDPLGSTPVPVEDNHGTSVTEFVETTTSDTSTLESRVDELEKRLAFLEEQLL